MAQQENNRHQLAGTKLPTRKLVVKNQNAGFFANFNLMVSALEVAELAGLSCQVDWSHNWSSSDFSYGTPGVDVWRQLFNGLALCDDGAVVEMFDLEDGLSGHCQMYSQTRRRALNTIYQRYIRPHTRLIERCERFQQLVGWHDDVLGVHVRHPHHASEQYGEGMPCLQKYWDVIASRPSSRVFVATDVEEIPARLVTDFGSRIVFQEGIARARANALQVHRNNIKPGLALAEDVFTDCMLLACCSTIVGVYSNVIWSASYMGPDIELVKLSGDGDSFDASPVESGVRVWRVLLLGDEVPRQGAMRDTTTGGWILFASSNHQIASGDLILVFERVPSGEGHCRTLACVAERIGNGSSGTVWRIVDATDVDISFDQLKEGFAGLHSSFRLDPLNDTIKLIPQHWSNLVAKHHGSFRLWITRSRAL